jgi:hypothetical protein
MTTRCSWMLVLSAALLGVGIAHAAADTLPPALRACATVKKNSERLACYDQMIEHLSSDPASAQGAPARTAEASFGASTPHGEQPVRTIEREELTSVSAHVTALSRDAAGALLINLDNGQQWLQTSGTSSPLLEIGHEVTITRAALNSFRLSTPSGRVLKVKRVL